MKSKKSTQPKVSRTEFKVPEGHLRVGQFTEHYGGVFSGLMRGQNGNPDYYLFVPSDEKADVALPWGGYGEDEPGAKDDFDGLANTIALCESKIDHPAAQFTRELKLYGLKDFYLPSREEVRLCRINCRELFKPEYYWSSTQSSATYAWVQGFYHGNQYDGHKGVDFRVRAVRRLVIQ